ncbi:trypsin-like cysteine/serine peptidase domain-containing protein [Dactylonectria estremocensis]|uniref:Trypsin-like cysteine/serine peptidase domain-containing protein n=1 Tax=Dactylonectria estremocensis TaxID=1079267 RepID=A0A9P9DJI5_9HYPO|nr:trypsin-like cysteine/serine peptidase domain-containing protein [Dactylonectria estremocensis]
MGQDNDSGVGQEWPQAINTVIPNVVSIDAYSYSPFDSRRAGIWSGTGFVANAAKDYVLTNCHAVGPGPIVVDARVVYHDPVHDFGFLQCVHVPVQVAGNDNKEKLRIMSAVLSCLDRNLLEYVVNCAATGGSSGSPVFSKDGEVIGVLSGGTKTTNFVIPLELPVQISRGDVQAEFEQKPPSRCRELGLTDELAKAIRMDHPGVAALLVAKIQEGDIIVQVDGEYITHPLRLGEILDRCVGKTLRFRPQRGASDTEVDVYVGNLYDIIPDRLVHAMQNNLPVSGVRLQTV